MEWINLTAGCLGPFKDEKKYVVLVYKSSGIDPSCDKGK